MPNMMKLDPQRLATITPAIAPSAVPMKRSSEIEAVSRSDDCVTTKVVIGAQ
jgi:hypothetical protein